MGQNWKEDWKQALDVLDSGGGDGDKEQTPFINLADGEAKKLIFLPGKPYGFKKVWDNLEGRGFLESKIGDRREMMPNGGARYESARTRCAFNVFDCEEKSVAVLDANQTTAKEIFQIFDIMGGPGKATFELKRTGVKKDTVFKLTKIKDLTEKQQKGMAEKAEKEGYDLEEVIDPKPQHIAVQAAELSPPPQWANKPQAAANPDDDESYF